MMTSENKISVQFRLSFRDILVAYRLHRAAATKEKDSHTIIGILLLLFGGGSLGLWFLQVLTAVPTTGDLPPAFSGLIIAFGVISILDLLPIAFSWIRFKQYIRGDLKPFQITFEDSSIRFDSQNSYAVYEWNFFQGAFEGKTAFLLMYGKESYSIIPKSAFQTEKEMEDFRIMLKGHLKDFKQELRF